MTVGLRQKPLRGHREEIPAQAADSNRAEIHTLLQAEIVDFDAEKQEATVKVLHKPRLNGEEAPLPELKKVPVVFPRGGGWALTWPIKKGDPGNIKIPERNIDAWYLSGKESPADTNRMHDLSDAIFEPGGMRSEPQKVGSFNTSGAELRSLDGETKIIMGDNGTITMKCQKFVLDCPDINLGGEGGALVHRIGDVDDAGDVAITGATRVKAV